MHRALLADAWQPNLCRLIVCDSNILWKCLKLQLASACVLEFMSKGARAYVCVSTCVRLLCSCARS